MRSKFLLSILLVLILFILPLVLGEAYFRLTSNGAGAIHELQAKADTANPCSHDEYIYPHPTLGIALKDKPECRLKVSNLGTHGEDLPWEKSADEFTILLLGGSVAQQVSATFPPFRINWVEKHLNNLFYVPGKKSIRVINGGNTTWKQPSQILQLMAYVDRIDAFVSLEGYNEISTLSLNMELVIPRFPYFVVTDLPDVARWKIKTFYRAIATIRRTPFLKNSFLVNKILIALAPALKSELLKNAHNSFLIRKFNPLKDNEVRFNEGLKEYRRNLEFLDGISKAHGKPGLVIFQPIAALKRGTYHLRDWQSPGNLDGETYQKAVNELTKIRLKHVKIKSLLGVYENERHWVYIDEVHSPVNMQTGYSIGYDRLGKAMAQHLGDYLRFKAKK